MRAHPLAMLLALLLLATPTLEAAGSRTESEEYDAGLLGDVITVCRGEVLLNLPPLTAANPAGNLGGACFRLEGWERWVLLRIEDDRGRVGGNYVLTGATGHILAQGFTCPSDPPVPVPPEATSLRVWVNGPKGEAQRCANPGGTGGHGAIHATFS